MIYKSIFFLTFSFATFAAGAVETDFFLENYFLAGVQRPRESDLNRDNRVFSTPSRQIEADLRGDFTARFNANHFVKIRPRWTLPRQWTEYRNPNEERQSGQGKVDLTDAY